MKKIQLSVLVLLVSTNLIMAGGDIIKITPYETEDIKAAEVVEVIPPVKKEVVIQAPIAISKPSHISPIYLGIGVTAARYATSCNCKGPKRGVDKTVGIVGRVGYDFNKYMGLEARAMYTSIKENGGKIKHLGAFVKPMYPVTNELTVYGLGGLAKTTTVGSLQRTDVNGLAFGAGFEYDFSDDKKKDAKYDRAFDGIADQEKGLGLFADYERLYYKSGSPDLDAVSVGVTYDF